MGTLRNDGYIREEAIAECLAHQLLSEATTDWPKVLVQGWKVTRGPRSAQVAGTAGSLDWPLRTEISALVLTRQWGTSLHGMPGDQP